MTSDERGVDLIGDEGVVERRVDLGALAADAVQERVQVVGDDLVDLGVVERRAQAAGEPLGPAGVRAAGQAGDDAQRVSICSTAKRTERGNSASSSRNSAMRWARRAV